MDNSETLVILCTQDTERRQTEHKSQQIFTKDKQFLFLIGHPPFRSVKSDESLVDDREKKRLS